MSDFVPTPAEDYPVVRERQLELPSGAKAIVRKPSMFLMLRRGQMPPEVREIVTRADPEAKGDKESITEAEMFTVLDCLVAAAFVSPKVTFKRRKGALCVEDIPDKDRMAIVSEFDLRDAV